jgi:hypothetical protein
MVNTIEITRRGLKVGTPLPLAPLPPHLEALLSSLPVNSNKRGAAAIISKEVFPVSYRTLEAWPIPTKIVNGQSVAATRDWLALAWAKYEAAPSVMGGRAPKVAA